MGTFNYKGFTLNDPNLPTGPQGWGAVETALFQQMIDSILAVRQINQVSGDTYGVVTPIVGSAVNVYEVSSLTGLGGAVTIAAPIGTPHEGDQLYLVLHDPSGTALTFSFNTAYIAYDPSLPSGIGGYGPEGNLLQLMYSAVYSAWVLVSFSNIYP